MNLFLPCCIFLVCFSPCVYIYSSSAQSQHTAAGLGPDVFCPAALDSSLPNWLRFNMSALTPIALKSARFWLKARQSNKLCKGPMSARLHRAVPEVASKRVTKHCECYSQHTTEFISLFQPLTAVIQLFNLDSALL